jgi:enolase
MLYIEGELLYKLNASTQESQYIVQVSNKQFKYNKTQIALLSPVAFKYFLHQNNPFILQIPSDFNSNEFISCFEQLNSLFYSTIELNLSVTNLKIFSHLADFLNNRILMIKCKKVN